MDEDWRNAFGILMCMEICDYAGAGICDGSPLTCSSSLVGFYECCSLLCIFSTIYPCFRLPIVQCPAYAYVVPMMALTKISRWRCPDYNDLGPQQNSTTGSKLQPNCN